MWLALALMACPAFAVDGVLEINQTCAVLTGCFSGDASGFPVTIDGSAGSSYTLTGNLAVPDANTTAISVSANAVTIDLGGFEIRGVTTCSGSPVSCSPSGSGRGIAVTSANVREVRVHNGMVTGMGSLGISLATQAIVEDVRVTQNRATGVLVNSSSIIRNSTAAWNGQHGLFGSNGSILTGNVSYQNGFDGISGGSGSLISGNSAYANGNDGILGAEGATIIDNMSQSNGDATNPTTDDGIECSIGCTVRGNTVSSNSGYGLTLGVDSVFRQNVVTDNTTGTVTGGIDRGDNYCAGNGTGTDFCP
jgi:hypothetical protein